MNLEHERIETSSTLYCVGGMVLMDSVLVTVDIKADTFFQVFDIPDFRHIGSYIRRGNGPDEEVSIDPFIKPVSENSFLYRNLSSIQMMTFDKGSNTLIAIEKIALPDSLMDVWHVIKLGDTIVGSNYRSTNKEFTGLSIATKQVFDFGSNYPDVGKKVSDHYKNMLYAKTPIVKPDGSAFAVVYDKFPVMRIYSSKGQLLKEVWYNNHQSFPDAFVLDHPSEYLLGEVMQNYRKIKASNQLIYALYIGKQEKELLKGLNDFSNEIHVWDWNGQPVAKILLDKKIFSFDVEKEDRYILCSSLEDMNGFYKYDLKLKGSIQPRESFY
jgi:hypothetical protein